MNVRPVTVEDAPEVARIHVETWRAAYRGMLPENVLDDFPTDRLEASAVALARDERKGVFMAVAEDEAGGDLLGFVVGGPERDGHADCDGELYGLYVHPTAQHRGIGNALFSYGRERLAQAGYHSMMLWTLEANVPARQFYERLGGVLTGARTIHILSAETAEVAYVWRELTG